METITITNMLIAIVQEILAVHLMLFFLSVGRVPSIIKSKKHMKLLNHKLPIR